MAPLAASWRTARAVIDLPTEPHDESRRRGHRRAIDGPAEGALIHPLPALDHDCGEAGDAGCLHRPSQVGVDRLRVVRARDGGHGDRGDQERRGEEGRASQSSRRCRRARLVVAHPCTPPEPPGPRARHRGMPPGNAPIVPPVAWAHTSPVSRLPAPSGRAPGVWASSIGHGCPRRCARPRRTAGRLLPGAPQAAGRHPSQARRQARTARVVASGTTIRAEPFFHHAARRSPSAASHQTKTPPSRRRRS